MKQIRLALGIPAGKFAIDCDISPGFLSNVEAGRKQPSDAVITRMAERLGVAKDDITYVITAQPSTDETSSRKAA